MITVVDSSTDCVVQKISNRGEVVRYQVVPKASKGDYEAVMVANTLVAARALIGKSNIGKPLNRN